MLLQLLRIDKNTSARFDLPFTKLFYHINFAKLYEDVATLLLGYIV